MTKEVSVSQTKHAKGAQKTWCTPRRSQSQTLTYIVVIATMIMLLYTMTTSFHETVRTQGGKKGVLQRRAKTPWFSNNPEHANAINYKNESLAKNKSENIYKDETAQQASFWDNILDQNYWSYSYSFDDEETDVESEESWHTQTTAEGEINETSADLLCPERIPVMFTDDGKRKIPQELYNMAKQVFDSTPTQFLDNLRNPCWKDETNNNISCLPAFFLAGFPKAGTTDLWAKIVSHPNIIHTTKEPHWWTRRRLGASTKSKSTTLQFYMKKFYTRLSNVIETNQPDADKFIVGDGSASTFWDNSKWKSYFDFEACKEEGPPYVTADIIHTVLPNSKIVVIMRNPTARVYSDYIFFGGQQRTIETFHRDVTSSIDIFNGCLKNASYRTCAYTVRKTGVRLVIGLYSVYVRDWLKAFPRNQIMFLRLEDWHDLCPELLPRVYTFLELDSLPEDGISEICDTKLKNPTKKYHGPMMDETRQILDDFYYKTRQELADILADNRFLWK